ncbi:MAG: MinD/ParA family protein [Firmicutes bacterium]|nr:MinD/ParA family protein [Bacillota bacterium]
MHGIKLGQRLSFSTDSEFHSDVYEAEIKAVHPDRWDIHLTFHRGYVLLLPVGTTIHWLSHGFKNMQSRVISRDTSEKVWSVTLPAPGKSNSDRTRVLAVGSGKGGVGKTTFSINLSLALNQIHGQVILLDADIGMANIEVLLGMQSSYNLSHVIQGECTLPEILQEGPGGIRILPGSSGIASLTQLDAIKFNRIIAGFSQLEESCSVLILDTGAGISEPVLKFLEAADDFLLLTTPEPHAMMDAYTLTKVLVGRNPGININLIVNRCESEAEARQCSNGLINAAEQFLGIRPVLLGWMLYDQRVIRSIKQKTPVLLVQPKILFSRQVLDIAHKIVGTGNTKKPPSGLKAFWKRIREGLS